MNEVRATVWGWRERLQSPLLYAATFQGLSLGAAGSNAAGASVAGMTITALIFGVLITIAVLATLPQPRTENPAKSAGVMVAIGLVILLLSLILW